MNNEETPKTEEKPKPVCVLCKSAVADGETRITTKSGGVAHLDCALVTAGEAARLKTPGVRGMIARDRARKTEKLLARAQKKHARLAKKKARET